MWLLLGRRSPNLSVSLIEVKEVFAGSLLWLAPNMKTPWVGIINVTELLVLCLPRSMELST